MRKTKPRLSIGLPVYNGENYLEQALDSILAQTYQDFELIITDNASSDRTCEICEDYRSKDKRIQYCRNSVNIGAAKNFNWAFELSTGEYFKWAAHDDLLEPSFLSRCVDVLDGDEDIILCFSKVKFIDENNRVIRDFDIELPYINSVKPQDRFGDLINLKHWCFHIFGLIRASWLRKTSLMPNHIGSDRNLLVDLGLFGRFYDVPEYLFYSREHPKRSVRALDVHERGKWFNPSNRRRINFPLWQMYVEYFYSLRQATLAPEQRLACYLHLAKWFLKYGKRFAKDLIVVH